MSRGAQLPDVGLHVVRAMMRETHDAFTAAVTVISILDEVPHGELPVRIRSELKAAIPHLRRADQAARTWVKGSELNAAEAPELWEDES